jgi:hypothetical protein
MTYLVSSLRSIPIQVLGLRLGLIGFVSGS